MEVRKQNQLIVLIEFDIGLTFVLRFIVEEALLGYRWWMKNIRQQQIQTSSIESATL